MMQRMMSVSCDRIVTGGILFLILFTPFAFGSVHPRAFFFIEAVVFFVVIVWMVKLLSLPFIPYSSLLTFKRLALPLALFVGLVLSQLLSLPPSLLRILSPSTYELYTRSLPGWPEKMPYEIGRASCRERV